MLEIRDLHVTFHSTGKEAVRVGADKFFRGRFVGAEHNAFYHKVVRSGDLVVPACVAEHVWRGLDGGHGSGNVGAAEYYRHFACADGVCGVDGRLRVREDRARRPLRLPSALRHRDGGGRHQHCRPRARDGGRHGALAQLRRRHDALPDDGRHGGRRAAPAAQAAGQSFAGMAAPLEGRAGHNPYGFCIP